MPQPRKRTPGQRRKRASKPTYSAAELQLALPALMREAGLPEPQAEYQFALKRIGRRWRLDYSWPEQQIALEVEGGTHIAGGGPHQRVGRGGRYLSDMEKYNTLACWGWLLVRVTYEMIADGRALTWLQAAFAYRAGRAGNAA